MSIDKKTFYNYILNNKTYNTDVYKSYLNSTFDKLPDKICSSKYINNILKNELDTNLKLKIFNETFMEYFKWKLKNEFS